MNIITKDTWDEINSVLYKHSISFITHYESRDVQNAMEYPDTTVKDKHIQINLVIPDYFGES